MSKTCPFCHQPICGEGWNPENGDRFYSHISGEFNLSCAYELAQNRDGEWRRNAK